MKDQAIPDDLVYRGSASIAARGSALPARHGDLRRGLATVMAGALGAFACGWDRPISWRCCSPARCSCRSRIDPGRVRRRAARVAVRKDLALEIIRRIGEGGAVDHRSSTRPHDRGLRWTADSRSPTWRSRPAPPTACRPDAALRRYLDQRDGRRVRPGVRADLASAR